MADDIFRDVEEALRDDKVKAFWRRWRFVIIGVLISIVVGVTVREFYQTNTQEQAQIRSDSWQEILSAPEAGRAERIEAFIAETQDEYTNFARFYQAREKAIGNKDEAFTLYNQIIANTDDIYGGLARIESAVLYLEDKNYLEAGQVLEPILQQESPFRGLALYYAAVSAIYQENYISAQAFAQSILDDTATTANLRNLAQEIHDRATLQNAGDAVSQ